MKIAKVESFFLAAQLKKSFAWSRGKASRRTACLVKITTDDGLVGWGEAGSHNALQPTAAVVRDVLAPLILGENPFDVEKLWRRMFEAVRAHGECGLQIEAISGVDIALWDLMGKATNLPLHRLLGGASHLELPVYASGMYYSEAPDQTKALLDEASRYVGEGFKYIKMKIGGLAPAADLRNVHAIQDAVGPTVSLIVDANGAYDLATAIRVGEVIAGNGVLWFEEPLLSEDLRGYKRLRHKVGIPISGGENIATRFGASQCLQADALDILQFDLCVAGGLTEGKKIHALASTWGTPCIPHVWGTQVALAATAHFMAACSDGDLARTVGYAPLRPLFEFDRTTNPLRDQLMLNPLAYRDGCLQVPTGPGLGVEIDEAQLHAFCIG